MLGGDTGFGERVPLGLTRSEPGRDSLGASPRAERESSADTRFAAESRWVAGSESNTRFQAGMLHRRGVAMDPGSVARDLEEVASNEPFRATRVQPAVFRSPRSDRKLTFALETRAPVPTSGHGVRSSRTDRIREQRTYCAYPVMLCAAAAVVAGKRKADRSGHRARHVSDCSRSTVQRGAEPGARQRQYSCDSNCSGRWKLYASVYRSHTRRIASPPSVICVIWLRSGIDSLNASSRAHEKFVKLARPLATLERRNSPSKRRSMPSPSMTSDVWSHPDSVRARDSSSAGWQRAGSLLMDD